MGIYIKNWSMAHWKELLKWAKIGANNSMIGELTEVEEVPPHGDLIDREYAIGTACSGRIRALQTTEDGEDWIRVEEVRESIKSAPTIIPAEEDSYNDR